MVKVMFGVMAAALLGFSCRADAWGGKKGEVRERCPCVGCRAKVVCVYLQPFSPIV